MQKAISESRICWEQQKLHHNLGDQLSSGLIGPWPSMKDTRLNYGFPQYRYDVTEVLSPVPLQCTVPSTATTLLRILHIDLCLVSNRIQFTTLLKVISEEWDETINNSERSVDELSACALAHPALHAGKATWWLPVATANSLIWIRICDPIDAPTTNRVEFILADANGCAPLGSNCTPNVVLLDYVNLGNPFTAAVQLNRLPMPAPSNALVTVGNQVAGAVAMVMGAAESAGSAIKDGISSIGNSIKGLFGRA
ncbi:hypothetical protein DFH08DRAFT_812493 [Mycena albidolilacea]|uniref:Uncharacterized protein n=1 Tax=Mycena albidolilacea TaxID=1033008 RepID=A0AAD7ELX7_9AGAR|nr:hypothetical protein DFH08DRAFT_812493 [Mycena albidolilacea]